MIKINLAKKKQAASGDEKGGRGGRIKLPDASALRELPLKKPIVYLGLCLAVNYFADDQKETEVAELDARIKKLKDEEAKLNAEFSKTKGYEQAKQQLEAAEKELTTKIETIQVLVASRSETFKLMHSLSDVIPKEVWLTDFNLDKGNVSISGAAIGFGRISDFLKILGETTFFTDLRLVNTKQEGKAAGGVEIASFVVSGKKR